MYLLDPSGALLPGIQVPPQTLAQLTWQTCWAPQVVNGPPPADCAANPGAQLNPVTWARNVNVREIQAANGGG